MVFSKHGSSQYPTPPEPGTLALLSWASRCYSGERDSAQMPRHITPTNKAVIWPIEQHGYRVCVGDDAGVWIASAKRDADNQFHVAKAPSEDEAIAELALLVGLDLADG